MAKSLNVRVNTHAVTPAARETLRYLQGSEGLTQQIAGNKRHQ